MRTLLGSARASLARVLGCGACDLPACTLQGARSPQGACARARSSTYWFRSCLTGWGSFREASTRRRRQTSPPQRPKAQRRVGGGQAGYLATPPNGVARAWLSARSQRGAVALPTSLSQRTPRMRRPCSSQLPKRTAERRFASAHKKGLLDGEPVLGSDVWGAPGSRACRSVQRLTGWDSLREGTRR